MSRTSTQIYFSTVANFPAIGNLNQLYIDNSTQIEYLWNGAAYVQLSLAAPMTMQQTYNVSLAPQIITSTPLGAVQIKRGSASDADAVFQVLTGAGVANFSISGSGLITQSVSTGTGWSATSSGLGGGEQFMNLAHAASGTLTACTTNKSTISSSRTYTLTSGSVTDNYSLGYMVRTNVTTGAGGTLMAQGSVLKLENIATQTAGTLTDSVSVLNLVQGNASTGGHILFNAYTPATAPTTEGTYWYHGTSKNLESFTNGIRGWANRGLYNMVTSKTNSGIVTNQSFANDTNAIGTRTIPANFWKVGKRLHVRLCGVYTSDANPGNATIQIRLGGVTYATTGSFAVDNTNTNSYWRFEGYITCRSTGAAGTAAGSFAYEHQESGTSQEQIFIAPAFNPVTIDTTAAMTVDVLWTADDVGTSATCSCFTIEECF